MVLRPALRRPAARGGLAGRAGPQVAMRMLKRSIYNAAEMTFEQSLDEIASKTAVTDHHSDAEEGMKAFQEKRLPHFNRWLE